MGCAGGEAAALRGGKVILVSGPVSLESPAGVERIDVRTAKEMHQAVLGRIADSSIAILAAALADYRPVQQPAEKIKKNNAALTLALSPPPDLPTTFTTNQA